MNFISEHSFLGSSPGDTMMMWMLVLLSFLGASECDRLPNYDYSPPPRPSPFPISPPSLPSPFPISPPSLPSPFPICGPNEIFHNGRCIVPETKDHVYLIRVPPRQNSFTPSPNIPPPKVWNNVLFVELPEDEDKSKTVVVPPPPQKNVVYVLRKNTQATHDVETLPTPPKTNPEVFFIDYNVGENPILPNGVDLQSALSQNAQHIDGQVVGGNNNGGSSSGGIIHGGDNSGGFFPGGGSHIVNVPSTIYGSP